MGPSAKGFVPLTLAECSVMKTDSGLARAEKGRRSRRLRIRTRWLSSASAGGRGRLREGTFTGMSETLTIECWSPCLARATVEWKLTLRFVKTSLEEKPRVENKPRYGRRHSYHQQLVQAHAKVSFHITTY